MRRSSALAALCAALLVGAATLLVPAATDDHRLAFSRGVRPQQVAVVVNPGERACQRPFLARSGFNAARFQVGTYGRPGPALAVSARDASTGALVGSGALAAGYPDVSVQSVALGSIPAGRRLTLCIEDRGTYPAALYGGPPRVARRGSISLDGRRVNAEMMLDFLREPRSMLSLLPTVFRRAALFHPAWVGAWTFWLLLVFLTLLVPVLLARAILAAERSG